MVICNIEVNNSTPVNIVIGRRGTYDTQQVVFNLDWLIETYGSGTAVLLAKRSMDEVPYPPESVAQDDNILTWTISDADTYYKGAGECELMWYVNGGLAKTIIYPVVVMRDIIGVTGTPPEDYDTWIETLTELAAETQAASQAIQDMSVSAETLPYTEPASVTKTVDPDTGAVNLDFGIPAGRPGGGGGGGGTDDYNELANKPQINGVSLVGNKTASQLNLGTYSKPSGGIPKTDLASDVQTSLGKADTALQSAPVTSVNNQTGAVVLIASDVGAYVKPSGGIPETDLSSAVQTSLGLADSAYQKPNTGIPKTDLASAVQTSLGYADSAYQKPSGGIPKTDLASAVQTSLEKADTALQSAPVISVNNQTGAVTLSASDVGAIGLPSNPTTGQMLVYNGTAWVAADQDNKVTVSGTDPSITAVAGTRYVCGEVATLTITVPESGLVDVVFTSGTTPTVISLLPANTVKMPDSWETPLDASTTYELSFLDRKGGFLKWT